jgi:diketogulonate reductase-like aldo/keto reductase
MQAMWRAMEAAKRQGKARSLGLINFCEGSLRCVLDAASEVPAVHYFMLHPGMGADPAGLRSFGEARGLRTFAYGAIGEPGPSAELLESPLLARIGKTHARSAEEVALRWVLQGGAAVSVRPTAEFGLGTSTCAAAGTSCADGLAKRAAAFSWSLSQKEMAELNALTSPGGNPTLFSSTGCPGSFFAST